MRIAFICTANVCRSVMAHAILERIVQARNLDIEVFSAGVNDFTGTPPADNAWLTCLQNNTSISKMESLFVGNLDLDRIECFLAMEHFHKDLLASTYRINEHRIRLLGTFDNESNDMEIADPINKPKKAFQDCFNRIERCIEGFLNQMSESEQDASGNLR